MLGKNLIIKKNDMNNFKQLIKKEGDIRKINEYPGRKRNWFIIFRWYQSYG